MTDHTMHISPAPRKELSVTGLLAYLKFTGGNVERVMYCKGTYKSKRQGRKGRSEVSTVKHTGQGVHLKSWRMYSDTYNDYPVSSGMIQNIAVNPVGMEPELSKTSSNINILISKFEEWHCRLQSLVFFYYFFSSLLFYYIYFVSCVRSHRIVVVRKYRTTFCMYICLSSLLDLSSLLISESSMFGVIACTKKADRLAGVDLS